MPRPQKTEYKKPIIEKIEYSSKEFFDLERELEKYKETKSLPIKKGSLEREDVTFVTTKGLQRWYIDNGGLADREEWTVCNIEKYKELQDKMEQYNNWQRRRDYAQKKELEGLEELSKTMQID